MQALLIVDVQNDFLPGGNLAVSHGNEIIPVINDLITKFDLVVATQDWHPQNHSSFASNHPGKKPFEEIKVKGKMQTLWPDHCVQGSHGAEFPEGLNTNVIEAIFRKGTHPEVDSYSAFYDNDRKKSTGLKDYLIGKGVDTLYVCGLAGDICVYFTMLDAILTGIPTVLVYDAAAPLDEVVYGKQLDQIFSLGGSIIRAVKVER